MNKNLIVIDERELLGKEFRIYGTWENPLFLARDVAEWIEHSDVSMMLKKVDEDEKVTNIVCTLGGNQRAWFLTEDGLYEVLMQSRKPIAKAFKKEVKSILKQIRKTGAYQNKPMSPMEMLELQFQVIKEQEEKLNEVDCKIEDLKENMPLFNVDCKEIQAAVRKKGVEILGGKTSSAYKNNSLRGKVYSDIQKQLKREFGVGKYEAIKRSQLEKAKEIISLYKAPLVLEQEITISNDQIKFED